MQYNAHNEREYYVYILANVKNTTLYIGVTNNISRRIEEHKTKLNKGFTEQYNVQKLVYVEAFSDVTEAIAREKQLKHWRREWKNALITKSNPNWDDLSTEVL